MNWQIKFWAPTTGKRFSSHAGAFEAQVGGRREKYERMKHRRLASTKTLLNVCKETIKLSTLLCYKDFLKAAPTYQQVYNWHKFFRNVCLI